MEYLSLYDYLKKPAGEQLGKEVAIAASKHKISTQTREVSNPNYTGKVNLYPKDFLDFYFREPHETLDAIDYSKTVLDDDDLPF
jgi:hypothetical protein